MEAIITSRSGNEVPQPKILIDRQPIVLAPEVTTETYEVKEKSEEASVEVKNVNEETETNKEYQPVSDFSSLSQDMRSGLQILWEKVSLLDQRLIRIEEYQASTSRGGDPMDTSSAPQSDNEDSEEGSDEEEEGDEGEEGNEEEKDDEESQEEDDANS
ncbi:uncharacterized protein LOC131143881 [Malania oleifera]|uniref:uncharacterized protein LOC131143881 n=1 Tax=Malania oleifera TaxID=397392 RepID=UPI0025ADC803|nr:uncharacterized protein LOC131143881 [Malania oleifera]